jgi:hypothetical protein
MAVGLAELRAWIQVPATVLSDPQLQQVLDAETILQARACTTGDPLAPDLVQALYRRVAREVAARGVPLGMLGADSEYGPQRLSRWDAEVDRLEAPNRRLVFG